MQAIKASEKWFRQWLLPALQERFPEVLAHIAVGVAGRGSECLGYDDDISRDHDIRNTVTIWIAEKDDAVYGFRLIRIYNDICKASAVHLPSEQESRLGSSEHGVVTIEDFFLRHLGYSHVPENWQQWLYTPEYAFAECVNGRLFHDGPGVFSKLRDEIRHGMPEDVRIKKLAARAVMMAQSGQYNYQRCLKHGEPGAAALALADFVKNGLSMVFLLNFSFAPYYKWAFRAMRELPTLGELGVEFEKLFSSDNKVPLIENICRKIISELKKQGLSELEADYLEPHAFALMSKIRSQELRTLHVMEG